MKMSALRRPEGDEVARKFGAYMTERAVCKLTVGDTFEVLCDGGIHYLGKVASINEKYNGTLHFCKWNEKFDIACCFKDLYLAPVGTYSTGTLNGANQYMNPNETNGRRRLKPSSESDNPSFADKTRYDDDFLSRPYRTNKKRRSIESVEKDTDGDNKKIAKLNSSVSVSFEKERAIKKEKHVTAAGTSPIATVSPSLSTAKRESPTNSQHDGEVPEDISLNDPTKINIEVVMTEPDPPSAKSIAAETAGSQSSSSLQMEHQQVQHRLLPAAIPTSTLQTSQTQGTLSIADDSVVADPVLQDDELPKPPAPVPLIVGSRNMQRWRQYYQEMLADRKEKDCQDAATAMAWLDAHLDTLRQRGRIKGKVHGPLGMLCMTEDRASAVILEHGIGQSNLLAFMVDRLLDQTYLEEEFREKQNLNVRVMFSGTRDRFQGYRPLSYTQRRPRAGCQLWNLADALTCGQLIRNCLHSEGCTSQTKLGGKVPVDASPRAMLCDLFLTSDSTPPVLYVAQESKCRSLEVHRFFLSEKGETTKGASSSTVTGPRYYTPEDFQAEVIYPMSPSNALTGIDTSAGAISDIPVSVPLRLMFSYEEQLALLETIPASLPTPQVRATAAVPANYSSKSNNQYHNSPQNPINSQRFPNFNLFDEKFAAERTREAIANRNSVGATAVWHLQSRQAGIFYPSRISLQIDLVSEYSASGLDGVEPKEVVDPTYSLPSSALGWFVPLSSFLPSDTDTPSLPIALVPDFFANTWPLEHAAAPHVGNDDVMEVSERSKYDHLAKHASEEQLQEEGGQTQSMEVNVAEKEGDGSVQDSDNNRENHVNIAMVTVDSSKECVGESDANKEKVKIGASVSNEGGNTEGDPVSGEEDRIESSGGIGKADGTSSAVILADAAAADPERTLVVSTPPRLSLHRKSNTFGLSFLDKQSFLVWHEAVSPDGEMEEFPEIPPSKVAFISLASMRMNQDYYDLKLLKRKHVTVFLDSKPIRADAVSTALRTATSASSETMHSSSSAILSPLPLSVLSSTGGNWQEDSSRRYHQRKSVPIAQVSASSGLGINSALPSDAKTFRSRLSIDTMIGNLQRAVDNMGHFQADLQASGVDTSALHKLLAAQLQLARASRLMLR